jgi:hypothetical protein
MRFFIFTLLLFFISMTRAQHPLSTKFLKFLSNGKTGLCDLKGKTIVQPEFKKVHSYCDAFYVATKDGKSALYKINGKTVYSFPTLCVDAFILQSGALAVRDSQFVYLFNKSLKPVHTIPHYGAEVRLDEYGNLGVLFQPEKKDSFKLYSVRLFETKNFKQIGNYSPLEKDDFKTRRTNSKKLYFTIELAPGGKEMIFIDSLGKEIFRRKKNDKLSNERWFEMKKGEMFEVDEDRTDEIIIDHYYRGKLKQSGIENLRILGKGENQQCYVLEDFYGTVLKTFPRDADVHAEKGDDREKVLYFSLSTYDSIKGEDIEDVMNTSFDLLSDNVPWFDPDSANYKNLDIPDPENGLLVFLKNRKMHLYDLSAQKEILSFDPDVKNVFDSKGLFPLSDVQPGDYFAYKDGNSYGIFYFKTGKKVRLFDLALRKGEKIKKIDVNAHKQRKTVEFEIRLVSGEGDGEEERDTLFSFLRKANGDYISLNGTSVTSVYPFRTYDTLAYEEATIALPFLAVTSGQRDSADILNSEGKTILKIKKQELYLVGKNYLGWSNGKKSKLFDMELRELKKEIPGVVCASLDGDKELICYSNQTYFLFKGGKSSKLFTENELLGWPASFINSFDSADYRTAYKIVHAEKRNGKVLLYLNVTDESMFQLALYDPQNGKLLSCPGEKYYDGTVDNEFSLSEFLALRYRLLKKQNDSASCLPDLYRPRFIADTLDYSTWNDETFYEMDKYLLGRLRLFSSRRDPQTWYLGTFDSIYHKFNGQPSGNEWECGIYYFGDNSESNFFLYDRQNHTFSADLYENIMIDNEAGCDDGIFGATNKRTKKQELFKISDKGYTKIYEGTLGSFQGVTSGSDGLGRSNFYYLFFKKDYSFYFAADKNFKPLFDTSVYQLASRTDFSYIWEGGANSLILEEKAKGNYFLLNGITGVLTPLAGKEASFEEDGQMHILLAQKENSPHTNLQDIVLVETGEIIKDFDTNQNAEWFIFNNKLYYRVFDDEGLNTQLYNARKEKIK